MKFIGITGGVGAGKSQILSYIGAHYRCEIYLADEVAHRVKEPGTSCYELLVELLGQEVLTPEMLAEVFRVRAELQTLPSGRLNIIYHGGI